MEKVRFDSIPLTAFGNTIQTVGSVLGSGGALYLVSYPAASFGELPMFELELTPEQWQALLRQLDECSTAVAWQKGLFRKSQRVIDSFVCWQVYKRDSYACRYCGRDDVPLTVDHVIRWEDGGQSVAENLITACKPCNRARGNMSYGEWLESTQYNPKRRLTRDALEANSAILGQLHHLMMLVGPKRTKHK